MPALLLRPGEHVRRLDGTWGVVVALHVRSGIAVRYHLTVAQDHTFAVGADHWVVHNCGGGSQAPDPRYYNETGVQIREVEKSFDSSEEAFAYAQSQVGDLGEDAVRTQAQFGEAEGLDNGMRSADAKRGWRLEWDPNKGAHFNYYDWSAGKIASQQVCK